MLLDSGLPLASCLSDCLGPPKRTNVHNGADRRSDHSGITQQGAQQPAGTKSLRETNVELREENLKTSPENLIITFAGLLERAILPEATGRWDASSITARRSHNPWGIRAECRVFPPKQPALPLLLRPAVVLLRTMKGVRSFPHPRQPAHGSSSNMDL